MAKRKRTQLTGFDSYVEHPRYGRGPRLTGANPQNDFERDAYTYVRARPEERVPNTAVAADVEAQVPCSLPVTHYYDIKRRCRDCGRPFLFFAEEQKFWYEELQITLDADCVRCVPCRRKARGLARTRARYEELHHVERGSEEELEFAECLCELLEARVVGSRAREKLTALVRRLPESERTVALRERIAGLESG